MTLKGASTAIVAAGAIVSGVVALSRTERVAALLATDEASARAIGVRDLTNGILLLAARDKRPLLAARALADLGTAWRYGRHNRAVLAASLVSAALAGIAYARS